MSGSRSHQIAGYTSLGPAVTSATLGLLRVEVHPYFGAATLGLIGYRDRLSYAWPHALLNGAVGYIIAVTRWAALFAPALSFVPRKR